MQRLLKSEFLINKKAESNDQVPKFSVCFLELANFLSTANLSTQSEDLIEEDQ